MAASASGALSKIEEISTYNKKLTEENTIAKKLLEMKNK